MQKTTIEWTDRTWNPVTGCDKVSQGCKFCYAEAITNRFQGKGNFNKINLHENRLIQPFSWRNPQKIFVNSMSDLFHEKVPFEFIDKVMTVMFQNPKHTFQVLTKRAKRADEYYEYRALKFDGTELEDNTVVLPDNLWLGVSVEDQKTANERIPILMNIPAAVRFISAEPLLGPINLISCEAYSVKNTKLFGRKQFIRKLDWVICGGESGNGARPMHPKWASDLQEQCQVCTIPFFFKQWGTWQPIFPSPDLPIAESKSICRINLAGGQGLHGEELTFFRRQKKKNTNRKLKDIEYSEFPKTVSF